MRSILVLLFGLILSQAYSQLNSRWVMAVSSFTNVTVVDDSTYMADVSFQSDQTGNGYLANQVQVGDRFLTSAKEQFRITAVNSSSFSTANLTMVELPGTTSGPNGTGIAYRYDGSTELVPLVPVNSGGISAALAAVIQSHNVEITATAGGGVPVLETRGDSVGIVGGNAVVAPVDEAVIDDALFRPAPNGDPGDSLGFKFDFLSMVQGPMSGFVYKDSTEDRVNALQFLRDGFNLFEYDLNPYVQASFSSARGNVSIQRSDNFGTYGLNIKDSGFYITSPGGFGPQAYYDTLNAWSYSDERPAAYAANDLVLPTLRKIRSEISDSLATVGGGVPVLETRGDSIGIVGGNAVPDQTIENARYPSDSVFVFPVTSATGWTSSFGVTFSAAGILCASDNYWTVSYPYDLQDRYYEVTAVVTSPEMFYFGIDGGEYTNYDASPNGKKVKLIIPNGYGYLSSLNLEIGTFTGAVHDVLIESLEIRELDAHLTYLSSREALSARFFNPEWDRDGQFYLGGDKHQLRTSEPGTTDRYTDLTMTPYRADFNAIRVDSIDSGAGISIDFDDFGFNVWERMLSPFEVFAQTGQAHNTQMLATYMYAADGDTLYRMLGQMGGKYTFGKTNSLARLDSTNWAKKTLVVDVENDDLRPGDAYSILTDAPAEDSSVQMVNADGTTEWEVYPKVYTVTKAAQETREDSLIAIDSTMFLTLPAGKYELVIDMQFAASSSGNFEAGLTADQTGNWREEGGTTANGWESFIQGVGLDGGDPLISTTEVFAVMRGTIDLASETTIYLQWGEQDTASVGFAKLFEGSFMKATRID